MLRRCLLVVGVLWSVACDSTAPPPFPAVAGTYDITVQFDAFPPSAARGNGSISFDQPTREEGALTGTANIQLVVGTSSGTVTTVSNAAVDKDGSITFRLGTSATGGTFWGFDGDVKGRSLSGTHILAGSTSSFTGTWTATRR
jgi:hypothetical protein